MYNPDHNVSPFHALPGAVVVLFCAMIGVELFFQAAESGFIGGAEAISWRLEYSKKFGFFDPAFDWMRDNKIFVMHYFLQIFTYSFIHLDFVHVMFVGVFILALGKFTVQVMNQFFVLLIFFVSAACGALGYSWIFDENILLLGGYPGVYGLIGSFTWITFSGLSKQGKSGFPAFRLICFFMIIQIGWKIVMGGSNQWFAELIGFCVGFALAMVLSQGSKQRIFTLLAKIRER